MAVKRMFDKTIIETDSFLDLSMTAKATYFLLGMEADDEGFVSLKRVTKIYGFTDDDVRLLIGKGYLIPFESGVVVITHWKQNNWLDARRTKPTQYIEEMRMLSLTNQNKYVLSTRLAVAKPEEYRGEENRIEESKEISSEDRTQKIREIRNSLSGKLKVK